MTITRLTVENIKRIVAVTITPDPKRGLVIIGGENAQGKTSVLDSIEMAIGGGNSIPAKPVREGEDGAKIVLKTEDITVTRKFKASGQSTLVVTNKEGVPVKGPQELLDSLTSRITFDPLAFSRLKSDAQADTVRKLVGIDFTALDAEAATAYAARTVIGRQVKQQQTLLDAMPFHNGVNAKLKDASALAERLQKATQENADNETKRGTLDDANDLLAKVERRISNQNDCINAMKKQVQEAEFEAHKLNQVLSLEISARDKIHAQVSALSDIDLDPIRAEIADLNAYNVKVHANMARAEAAKNVETLADEAKQKTERLEAIEKEKQKELRKATFPIDGLSFTGSGLFYNDLPFDQASAAEQLRVSVAIGAAMQPKLKVCLVRDGSLLDDKSLILLAAIAEEYGVQCFVERVGDGKECSVIIEDGSVKEDRTPTTQRRNQQVNATKTREEAFTEGQ